MRRLVHAAVAAALVLICALDANALPRPDHVVVVIEENHSYTDLIASADAVYLHELAAAGALFTRSYAVTHPSQPNYLALFSGSTQGVIDDACPLAFNAPSLASELGDVGLGFTGYSESMPTIGYVGCEYGAYRRKHNPWSYFTDLPPSLNRRFADFPGSFDDLPTVAFVVPDMNHDMHDGSVAEADAWLRENLGAYVTWAQTHNSLLIVTWDEDDDASGNQIPTIFVGPMVKPGAYKTPITHYDVLRTLEDMYGLAPLGQSATVLAIVQAWVPPAFTSPDTGHAIVGQPFAFALAATGGAAVVFSAGSPLPPGVALAGGEIVGTPTTVGTWRVDLSAATPLGTASQSLIAVVTADADADGIPDELEDALSVAPVASSAPLEVDRLSLKLKFTKAGKDSLQLSGACAVPPGFTPAGAHVVVDLAGIVRSFTLDPRGRSLRDPAHPNAKLSLKLLSGGAAFSLRDSKTHLAPWLADEGISNSDATNRATGALVTLVLDTTLAEKIEPLRYTATVGRSGTASAAN